MIARVRELFHKLPGGSGINGNWSVMTNDTNGDVIVSNTYSAMLEGMYCHDWDFQAAYRHTNEGEWEFVGLVVNEDTNSCECGHGLKEYLEELMPY